MPLPISPGQPAVDGEAILVLGSSDRTLDLLRLAVLRSDNVTAVGARPDPRVRRFADNFAVDLHDHRPGPDDLEGAAAVLIAIGDRAAENQLVRAARRRGIPVYVAERPLVSDFTPLQFIERRPFFQSAA